MKRTTFPCPVCKGSGILEEGDWVDVGIGSIQVSADDYCTWCDDGQMVIGGKKHIEYRKEIMGKKA